MKSLVVYDSFFGNTEKIARAIAEALRPHGDVVTLRVGEVKPEQLTGAGLLVVGSPTRAFRPTPAVMSLLGRIPAGGLRGVTVAAFDTRISLQKIRSRLLRFLVGLFGHAAAPIAARLRRKGGALALDPEGFFVEDTEGPLARGELERAGGWAGRIAAAPKGEPAS